MSRKSSLFACALAMGTALLPSAALADDPRDPTMKSAAARARDSAETRRLNQGQLSYVRDRDARILGNHSASQSEIDRVNADARADYARKMAAWRRAVAACNAGHWDYCDK